MTSVKSRRELEREIPGHTCPVIDEALDSISKVEDLLLDMSKVLDRLDINSPEDFKENYTDIEAKIHFALSEIDTSKEEIESVRKCNSDLRETIQEFINYYVDLAGEYEYLREDLKNSEHREEDLKEEKDSLNRDLVDAENIIRELEQTIKELETNLSNSSQGYNL